VTAPPHRRGAVDEGGLYPDADGSSPVPDDELEVRHARMANVEVALRNNISAKALNG
jgi:hypothetical protein